MLYVVDCCFHVVSHEKLSYVINTLSSMNIQLFRDSGFGYEDKKEQCITHHHLRPMEQHSVGGDVR